MRKVAIALLVSAGLAVSTVLAAAPAIAVYNWLGTGSNPNLTLTLASNGAGWNPFPISYGSVGNVPCSSNASDQWSAWNVTDAIGNLYGTINLNSDCNAVTWGGYTAGTQGYYLSGINFGPNSNGSAYQLTVNQIITPISAFLNAPEAVPATYSDGTSIVLSTNDQQIINNHAEPIILKGLVRPSLEWNPEGQYLSTSDFTNMSNNWKANVIRIDLNESYWLDPNIGPTYQKIINAMVYYAIQNNMAVILDLHWLTQNQSPMADQNSLTFWTQVAQDYKNFGTVIFELYNEPEGFTDSNIWLNGGTVTDPNSGNSYTAVGYQALYNAVRAADANNLVIVNGMNYGYDLSFVTASFQIQPYNGQPLNIIYGSHPYDKSGVDETNPTTLDENLSYVLANYPVIFTEFGDTLSTDYPNGYENAYNNIVGPGGFVEIHPTVNYTAFAWWVGEPDFPALISDWTGTPLNGGTIVQTDMLDHPGTPLTGSN